MLLAIDVGNTNVTLGLWNGEEWQTQWRLRTTHRKTVDEYWIDLRTLLGDRFEQKVDQVVLSSVVPPLTKSLGEMSRKYLEVEPIIVNSDLDTGVKVETDNPAEVGADRIVNAVAAFDQYGGPAIVIDMGTATTFDYINENGALLGVVISPGLQVAGDALASRASQLNNVALEAPPTVLGKNTITAMQSGLIYGYVGLVEGMVWRLSHEMRTNPVVIGTGGLMNVLKPLTAMVDHYDPWLTLTGLRLISDRQREDVSTS